MRLKKIVLPIISNCLSAASLFLMGVPVMDCSLLVMSKGILICYFKLHTFPPNLYAIPPKICFISVSFKLANDITKRWVLQAASVVIVVVSNYY